MNPKIGVGYTFSDNFWTELRTSNFDKEHPLTAEIIVCGNILRQERYNFYVGAGVIGNKDKGGFVLPLGIQFYPSKKSARLSILTEMLTKAYIGDKIHFKGGIGIRYQFGS